jgi:hypothetical protein
MIDLDPILRAARDDTEWSDKHAASLLQAIASRFRGGVVDWDEGSEEWGRVVLDGKDVVALVCRRLPLGIAKAAHAHQMPVGQVTWIVVELMSEPKFRVGRLVLEQAFGRQLSDNVNYEQLSANDLWWATV